MKNKEQWRAITSLIDGTPERTAEQLAAMNQAQLDEVQRVFRQLELVRKQEDDRLRQEQSMADREMREVC